MAERPYTVLSCALSLDGYLDDASARRLLLSCPDDLERVDALRATADAILVGATTIRKDNPRLLVRSGARRAARVGRGLTESPIRVTLTHSGVLDPAADFFAEGGSAPLVYCDHATIDAARARFGSLATVIDGGDTVGVDRLAEDLGRRGVGRLMVEGGGTVFTQFLTGDLVDELQLAVAPLFVGDPRAPRFVRGGTFPWRGDRRATLVDARMVGDVALLRYALSSRFARD